MRNYNHFITPRLIVLMIILVIGGSLYHTGRLSFPTICWEVREKPTFCEDITQRSSKMRPYIQGIASIYCTNPERFTIDSYSCDFEIKDVRLCVNHLSYYRYGGSYVITENGTLKPTKKEAVLLLDIRNEIRRVREERTASIRIE